MIRPSDRDRPGRLWSLWDMQRVYAHRFVESTRYFAQLREIANRFKDDRGVLNLADPKESADRSTKKHLEQFRDECEGLHLRLTVKHVNRLLNDDAVTVPDLGHRIDEVYLRFRDELVDQVFFAIAIDDTAFVSGPTLGWESVVDRFECSFDVEEARKCIALDRHTAAVFHLMRVVEHAVLDLQVFLADRDVKAHFGSVVKKLEHLCQGTKYQELPDHLRPHGEFMRSVLTQLHAVKDSWRDKVAHVDARIVPSETFTGEMAHNVHDATLALMKRLVDGLPPKEVLES